MGRRDENKEPGGKTKTTRKGKRKRRERREEKKRKETREKKQRARAKTHSFAQQAEGSGLPLSLPSLHLLRPASAQEMTSPRGND